MKTERLLGTKTRTPRLLLAMGGILSVSALLVTDITAAGFVDSTYGAAELRTESPLSVPPVDYDQSANSSLFLSKKGDLFIAGDRRNGDGNGTTKRPTDEPTRVVFPVGVKIVDAVGSTNDFHTPNTSTNSYMALDNFGGVWTWGAPYGGADLLGHGGSTTVQSRTARRVTRVDNGNPLPEIIQISRSENQFYAIDRVGRLWVWGYGSENLPSPTAGNKAFPTLANKTTLVPQNGQCDTNASNHLGEVRWHSLWGGNNSSGAVATNGLVYSWGYDTSNGLEGKQVDARCPSLNEGVNRVLFQKYPSLYMTLTGQVYDEAVLVSEAQRHARYLEIVQSMRKKELDECSTVKSTGVVDDSACPIRQLGFSARAGRLLLQNGEYYTWKISSSDYGDPFLAREVTTSAPAVSPQIVTVGGSTNSLDRVVSGVSSSFGLTRDGVLYGWGENNYCQAVGAPTSNGQIVSADCAATGTQKPNGRRVVLPTPVQQLPADQPIVRVAATQCAAWAETASGELWAWGGGTISAHDYRYCRQPEQVGAQGYKIYDYGRVTAEYPMGLPVMGTTTGTTRVRGE